MVKKESISWWKNQMPEIDSNGSYTIDPNKEKALLMIINDCKSNGIRLLLVNSPAFIKLIPRSDANPIMQIAKNHKVEYLDFSSDPTYLNNNNYYFDPMHLNETGAKLFSETLAGELQKSGMDLFTLNLE
jgi:hypothetical protein